MTKITFIGAGSLGFTGELVRDILTFPLLEGATLSLMDIDVERLEWAKKGVEKLVAAGNHPAKVEATLDRVEALKGADVVLTTILAGSTEVWRHDIEIPMKYGVDINVGDTRGPSGIFRFLRTINPMMDIVRDMERYCPNAVLLNYTNPMAMLVSAIQKQSFITTTGLCHSVQGSAMMLADWIGASYDEIDYTCAGINHQAWYLEYKWNGQDAYPLIHKAITERPGVYNEEPVRNEMYLALGKYVTESSGHNSEYNWWFRKRPDLIEKYCTHGKDWNPGVHRYILDEYENREKAARWQKHMEDYASGKVEIRLGRSHEYASSIVRGLMFDELFEFNATVPNTGLIPNLPQDCAVEVPVIATKAGFSPVYMGPLPPQCAALNNINTTVNELAVESAIKGDPQAAYLACCFDPLAAAALSLAEIKQMVDELFKAQAPLLPQFKHLT